MGQNQTPGVVGVWGCGWGVWVCGVCGGVGGGGVGVLGVGVCVGGVGCEGCVGVRCWGCWGWWGPQVVVCLTKTHCMGGYQNVGLGILRPGIPFKGSRPGLEQMEWHLPHPEKAQLVARQGGIGPATNGAQSAIEFAKSGDRCGYVFV